MNAAALNVQCVHLFIYFSQPLTVCVSIKGSFGSLKKLTQQTECVTHPRSGLYVM